MDGAANAVSSERRASNKRTYSTMASAHAFDSSSLFLPLDDHYHNEHATRRPRLALPPMRTTPPSNLTTRRFPGDGLDMRRPMMATAAAPVIDLTDDVASEREGMHMAESSRASRLPRFGISALLDNDLVFSGERDLSTSDSPHRLSAHPNLSQLRRAARFGEPTLVTATDDDELEIVSERTLPRSHISSRRHTPVPSAPRSLTPYPGDFVAQAIDLTEDDEVVHVDTRPREGHGLNNAEPGVAARADAIGGFRVGHMIDMLRATGVDMAGRLAQRLYGQAEHPLLEPFGDDARWNRYSAQHHHTHHHHHDHRTHGHHHHNNHTHDHHTHGRHTPHVRVSGGLGPGLLHINMNYHAAAFDLGLGGAAERPQTPYAAPDKPEAGFTRNPAEDEVVVCPNCGDELAVSDDEIKQQVWVVKACGHAYCGLCARNRQRRVSKKGKGKVTDAEDSLPMPFSKCVVEGCGKPTGKAHIIQIYLGS